MAVQQRYNAASVLSAGRVSGTYCKRELPNYQVFDERRYFVSGRDAALPPLVFEAGGLRFGGARRRTGALRGQRLALPPGKIGRA